MKKLRKLSRNKLKSLNGGVGTLGTINTEGRLYQCCKEGTYDCGGCHEGGCGAGYYAIYCGTNNPPSTGLEPVTDIG